MNIKLVISSFHSCKKFIYPTSNDSNPLHIQPDRYLPNVKRQYISIYLGTRKMTVSYHFFSMKKKKSKKFNFFFLKSNFFEYHRLMIFLQEMRLKGKGQLDFFTKVELVEWRNL